MPVANAATFTFKPPSSPSLMNPLILLLLVNSTSIDHLNKKTPLFHYLQKLQKIQLKYSVSNQINRNEMPHPQGNMIQNVHYNAFLRKLDHTPSKAAMYYIHKKTNEIHINSFTTLHTPFSYKCLFESRAWKIRCTPLSVYVRYTHKLSNVH